MFQYRRLSDKLVKRFGYYGDISTYGHWCPGCKSIHDFAVEQPFRNGARWTYSGVPESPTFSPSMNISVGPFPDGTTKRCHYFLRGGRIQFLNDSTHELAGQTVDLPDIPSEALKWSERIG
jgi:hypothetical protein